MTGPVVICYDGSAESADALAYAAALLPGARAVVLTVWKPIVEEALSPATTPPVADPVEANTSRQRAAAQVAADGARRASQAGLDAEPLAITATGPLWEAVELVAEERDARLIVCGTSRSGIKSTLPGNLAGALVDHAGHPVLVVPSAKAMAERRHDVHERRGRVGGTRVVSGPALRH